MILDNQRKMLCEKVASPVCGMQEDRWKTLFPCPDTSITRLPSCPITIVRIHWPGLCWTLYLKALEIKCGYASLPVVQQEAEQCTWIWS